MTDNNNADSPSTPAVVPLPVDWPGRPLTVMPGDFSQYAPDGMGLGMPPLRPWDSFDDALRTRDYYGFAARESDPVLGAPRYDPRGGTIYFDGFAPWETLSSTLTLIGVNLLDKDFVVFQGSATQPLQERYADQARIMRRSALARLLDPHSDLALPEAQTVTVGDYVQQFLGEQKTKWKSGCSTFTPSMYGMFGGDGDWAKEDLCFGFLVENSYLGVYRIWSRAWLVTK